MTAETDLGLPVFDPTDRVFLDPSAQTFWENARQGQLAIQRCASCGTWRWPPRGLCARCHSWDANWHVVAGDGTLVAWVAVHRPFEPVFAKALPYLIGLVSIAGTGNQAMMLSNVIGVDPSKVRVGLPVRVVFGRCTAGGRPPVFEVCAAGDLDKSAP